MRPHAQRRRHAGTYRRRAVWIPAFYTNVTDAYRLNRAGRLRTDLGGIYFNAVVIVLAGAAASTGWPPLLALIALSHLEILQQLLPIVRFDGYYILGDLAGVPNLFGHVRPILRSFGPGRRRDPAVASPADQDPRRRHRLGPCHRAGAGRRLRHADDLERPGLPQPGLAPDGRAAGHGSCAAEANQWGAAAASMLGVLVIFRFQSLESGWCCWGDRPSRPCGPAAPGRRSLSAAVPAPRTMTRTSQRSCCPAHPRSPSKPCCWRVAPPRHGWRRGLYVVSRGRLNLGPSAAERREQAMIARIRTASAVPVGSSY